MELLLAGLRGARMNVAINLGMLKDAACVALVGEESARLESDAHARVAAARDALREADT